MVILSIDYIGYIYTDLSYNSPPQNVRNHGVRVISQVNVEFESKRKYNPPRTVPTPMPQKFWMNLVE